MPVVPLENLDQVKELTPETLRHLFLRYPGFDAPLVVNVGNVFTRLCSCRLANENLCHFLIRVQEVDLTEYEFARLLEVYAADRSGAWPLMRGGPGNTLRPYCIVTYNILRACTYARYKPRQRRRMCYSFFFAYACCQDLTGQDSYKVIVR